MEKLALTADSKPVLVVDIPAGSSDLNLKNTGTRARLFADQTLRDIAKVNPQAASILHIIDTTTKARIDLAKGVAYSSAIATRESVGELLKNADSTAIAALEQKIGADEGVRVEWRILESADGLASGLVTSHLLDKDGRVLRTLYPAVRLEFAMGKNFRLLSWSVAE